MPEVDDDDAYVVGTSAGDGRLRQRAGGPLGVASAHCDGARVGGGDLPARARAFVRERERKGEEETLEHG